MKQTIPTEAPQFPNFKRVELTDREFIHDRLQAYQPSVSELTFTNLYIWRHYYQFQWSVLDGFLVILVNPLNWGFYFLQPIGTGSRKEIIPLLLDWLRTEKDEFEPRIERVDKHLVSELQSSPELCIEELPDQFDYVYQTDDLIHLAGRKYHSKKNHINKFRKTYPFEYQSMNSELIDSCNHVLKRWCNWRECDKKPIMRAEFDAVHEALLHFKQLELRGGVILVEGEVMAFALGELLNKETALIHAEKTDPKISELFAMINQQVCEHEFADVPYMNREQDMGQQGLRRAKRSYHPIHMIEKFRIQGVKK